MYIKEKFFCYIKGSSRVVINKMLINGSENKIINENLPLRKYKHEPWLIANCRLHCTNHIVCDGTLDF